MATCILSNAMEENGNCEVERIPTVGKKGFVIHRRSRAQIKEFGDRLLQESEEKGLGKSKNAIAKEVSSAFGICVRTFHNIMKEHKAAEESGERITTPGKKRPRARRCVDSFDPFMQDAMRRHIHSIYIKQEYPTLNKVFKYAKEELGFIGQRTSVWLALKNMGFKYKVYNGRKILLEQHHVQLMRAEYLRKWRQYTTDERPMIYLDETWLWQHAAPNMVWQSPDVMPIRKSTGKGKRIILLHAGGKDGFIPNACLLFVSNSGAADYHKDMDGEVFKNWFITKLLPNIPPQSVIVMDNAPYHSMLAEKVPTSSTRKAEILEWLFAHNIREANATMSKVQLYELVRQNKPRHKRFVLDDMAVAAGHNVLRLPPYHCQLNPIELIWAKVKTNVARRNTTFRVQDVVNLTRTCLDEVSAQLWSSCIRHTDRLTLDYLEKEPIIEIQVEEMVITGGSNSGTSDEDTDSE